ncbi:hypothetical protein [Paenibacillus sp. KN14-4R]|uniref:hypothetical protein n=1 Tax=Paenibacillus sp. KN14-4R TaxID=3445773 RepID=UPI003F9F7A3D
MRKLLLMMTMLVFVLSMVLSGCGAKMEPKKTLENAFSNMSNIKSGDFKMSFALNLEFPEEAIQNNTGLATAAQLLKNMEVNVNGTYQKDPMQLEMNLEAHLKGDMQMNFTLPIVMNEKKVWIKVPNIPMLPLPKNIVGKFVELDMKELAEKSDQKITLDAAAIQKQQEFGKEVMKTILKNVDEKTYFTQLDKKNTKLPETVEADRIVNFAVKDENLEAFVTTVVEKVLPELLDLMSNEKYAGLFNIDKAEVEKMKKELANKESLKSGLEEIKKALKINDLQMTTAVNKKDFPAYFEMNVDLANKDAEAAEKEEPTKFGFNVKVEYSKINEQPQFKTGIPKDTITLDQLQSQMNQ